MSNPMEGILIVLPLAVISHITISIIDMAQKNLHDALVTLIPFTAYLGFVSSFVLLIVFTHKLEVAVDAGYVMNEEGSAQPPLMTNLKSKVPSIFRNDFQRAEKKFVDSKNSYWIYIYSPLCVTLVYSCTAVSWITMYKWNMESMQDMTFGYAAQGTSNGLQFFWSCFFAFVFLTFLGPQQFYRDMVLLLNEFMRVKEKALPVNNETEETPEIESQNGVTDTISLLPVANSSQAIIRTSIGQPDPHPDFNEQNAIEYIEFVETYFETILSRIRILNKSAGLIFGLAFISLILVLMYSAINTVYYYEQNSSETVANFWWLFYGSIALCSLHPIITSMWVCAKVPDEASISARIFRTSSRKFPKSAISVYVAHRFEVVSGALSEVPTIKLFGVVDMNKPLIWSLIVLSATYLLRVTHIILPINNGNITNTLF